MLRYLDTTRSTPHEEAVAAAKMYMFSHSHILDSSSFSIVKPYDRYNHHKKLLVNYALAEWTKYKTHYYQYRLCHAYYKYN